jgi:hypothetical protein
MMTARPAAFKVEDHSADRTRTGHRGTAGRIISAQELSQNNVARLVEMVTA